MITKGRHTYIGEGPAKSWESFLSEYLSEEEKKKMNDWLNANGAMDFWYNKDIEGWHRVFDECPYTSIAWSRYDKEFAQRQKEYWANHPFTKS